MPNSNTFVIQSERSRHKLFLNGQVIGTFDTLNAAEAEANEIASGHGMPGVRLPFALDFKWTLSDLEIRVAIVENIRQSDRDVVGRSPACG